MHQRVFQAKGVFVVLLAIGSMLTVQCTRKPVDLGERTLNQPDLLKETCEQIVGKPRILQVTPKVSVAVGYDLANVVAIRTSAGWVIVDVAMNKERARAIKRDLLKSAPTAPVKAIVYTHSHIDHVGGASEFMTAETQIWATESFRGHFLKQYGLMRPTESRGAARQFGKDVSLKDLPCTSIGRRIDFAGSLDTGARMPTDTFVDRQVLTIGDTEIVLQAAPGETQDQLMVWLPKEKVLLPGDNFYRSFPNLYTIRGTSKRPVDLWVRSLDKMRGLDPAFVVPHHTLPLAGQDMIRPKLQAYRDAIQWVHDETVRRTNRGDGIDLVADEMRLPKNLAQEPHLQELYGQIDWSVRGIYASYLGWSRQNPPSILPMNPREAASREVSVLGGTSKVLEMAQKAKREGELAWAIHLLAKLQKSGEDSKVWGGALAETYRDLAAQTTNTNARALLLQSSHEIVHGLDPLPKPKPEDELLRHVSLDTVFSVMSTRLRPEVSEGVHETVKFEFSGERRYFLTVRNGVLEVVRDEPLPGTPEPIASVTTDGMTWRNLAVGKTNAAVALATRKLRVSGSHVAFGRFMSRFRRGTEVRTN